MDFLLENPHYLWLLLIHFIVKVILIAIIWKKPNLLKSQKIFGSVGTFLSTLVGLVLLFAWKENNKKISLGN
jgi:hypothetical protein